jgi:type IV pilus assembly protein PilA
MTVTRVKMPSWSRSERGFGIVELVVVMGLIGLLATLAVPNFLRYYRNSALGAGASELATVLNRARQLAVTQNTTVCVEPTGAPSYSVRFHVGTCATAAWTGPGTTSAGLVTLSNGLRVGGATSAVFTNLGAASTTATYTVTDTRTTRTRSVSVAATGRVFVQ